ncbi:PAS domain S-box protein [Synechococcus sp. RSCCF101]|uniref:PAS domain-containing sensor histidine kinase n=1 Tax=Synechococcus sp. RSCCF101 TaxID=2511069 RepID=UPI001247A5D3|nr:PAS domain-containing sensor histidine kinase [Synechococcus sp. RSCCF101]QEY30910.1 PAS domain S-box protein [Synechococcus sp. RSCCF101]
MDIKANSEAAAAGAGLASAAVATAVLSAKGAWIEMNRSLQAWLGVEQNPPIGMSWEDVTHPDDRERDRQQIDRMARGHIRGITIHKRFIRADGGVRPAAVTIAVLENDAQQHPKALLALISDEADFADSAPAAAGSDHAQLEALFDGMDDVIYVSDPDSYDLLYVNAAFKAAWGDDVVGRKCHEVLQNRDSPCPFCTNKYIFNENLGQTYRWEFRNEQNKHWYGIADKAIRWSNGKMVRLELARDITDSKTIGDERLRLEKFTSLGHLTAGLAHELNNPLMGIINFAQYCLKKTDATDSRHEVLKDIEHEARRCAAIVKDLLSFSRHHASSENVAYDVSLNTLVDQVLRLLQYRGRKENIAIEVDAGRETIGIRADPNAIQQVLINLLTNAFDAVTGCETRRVRIGLSRDRDHAVLEIEDTGPGIPADQRTHIFDPFYTTKPEGKGTGLGLSTSWSIIQEHKGTIDCFSREGHGTTMTVRLPSAGASHQAAARQPAG